jgi:hypothetical protein
LPCDTGGYGPKKQGRENMRSRHRRPWLAARVIGTLAAAVLALSACDRTPEIDFGADTGPFQEDGECDDPRFTGPLTTSEGKPFLDATDCTRLYNAGTIRYRGTLNARVRGLDFGDDSGQHSRDGDCDDPRFEGYNTTTVGLVGTDAADCKALWDAHLISLRPKINEGMRAPDFGDDAGDYAKDGDCDDPRFEGLRTTDLAEEGRDASDCKALWEAGLIRLR